jgi:6-phosphogluconolactonase
MGSIKSCCRVVLTLATALVVIPGALRAQFVYVANSGSVTISGYTINGTTGAFTPTSGSPYSTDPHASPESVAVDPSGKFAYVANVNGTVSGYAIDSTTGVLTPIEGSPFPAGGQPGFVTVDPNGRFVYVANLTSNNISAYTIDRSTGELAALPGSPFPAGEEPGSLAVHPSGRFLYVTNFSSQLPFGSVSGYTIDSASGSLAAIPGSPFAAGSTPRSVSVDPSGKFAYVANGSGNSVSAYTINSDTGALTTIPGSPFPTGAYPFSVAVDPTGKFAYVANFTSGSGTPVPGSVSGYTINSDTGALTAIAGSPFPAGVQPGFITVDPNGKFVYAVNSTQATNTGIVPLTGSVSGYVITQSTGVLTAIPGSPFLAGIYPASMAITRCRHRPRITDLSASPATLWPPDHRLVDVLVDYDASAPCGEPPVCHLSVASNEPVKDDERYPDWIVLDDHHVELRAERSRYGTERIYTITIHCKDASGNSATRDTVVTVSHDQEH